MTEPRIEIVTPCRHNRGSSHLHGYNMQECTEASRVVYTREEAGNYAASKGIRRSVVLEVLDALLGAGE